MESFTVYWKFTFAQNKGNKRQKHTHTAHMQPANERTIEQTCIEEEEYSLSFERIHKIDDVLSVQLIIKVYFHFWCARIHTTHQLSNVKVSLH